MDGPDAMRAVRLKVSGDGHVSPGHPQDSSPYELPAGAGYRPRRVPTQRLAVDLTADELAGSVLVQNALVLLGAVAKGDGRRLTARENLTRRTVAVMRDAAIRCRVKW